MSNQSHAHHDNRHVGPSRRRHFAAAATAALSAVLAGSAQAQNAVSAANAKVDLRGGYEKSIEAGLQGGMLGGTGSYTLPLGQSFGFQIDGGVGWVDKELYGGAAAHLFWRNPATGLLGIIGQASTLDSAWLGRAAGRGEWYAKGITFGGYGGYQLGNRGHSVRVKDGFIAGLDATGYATENFAIKAAVGYDAAKWYARAGLEFQPGFTGVPGLAFFAEGGGGETRQVFGLGGVRIYFGPDKSLMRRHREDDPAALPFAELPQYRKYRRGEEAPPTTPPPDLSSR